MTHDPTILFTSRSMDIEARLPTRHSPLDQSQRDTDQPYSYNQDPAERHSHWPLSGLSDSPFLLDLLSSFVRLVETKDPRTAGHGERTTRYALALGQTIGLSENQLRDLRCAAYLHDIGKLSIPEELLLKEGPLTAEEYVHVQSHPREGAALLDPWPSLQTSAIWIAHHHERWDGSGYPYGLRGDYIPIGARILAIADTFDVLTTRHFQGPPRDLDSALALLCVSSGSQFDPDLVETFLKAASTFNSLNA